MEERNKTPTRYSSSKNIKLTGKIASVTDIRKSKKGNPYFLVTLDGVKIPFAKKNVSEIESKAQWFKDSIGEQTTIEVTQSGYGENVEESKEQSEPADSKTDSDDLCSPYDIQVPKPTSITLMKCPKCNEPMTWFKPELVVICHNVKKYIKDLEKLLLDYSK